MTCSLEDQWLYKSQAIVPAFFHVCNSELESTFARTVVSPIAQLHGTHECETLMACVCV